MANMWDLTGTLVAANYRKVKPSTQLGTRKLRFIKVVVTSGPDLTTNQGDSDSAFSKAVLAMQNYGEVWVIGKPSSDTFCMVMSDDTIQDSAVDTNVVAVPGAWSQAEANVTLRLGAASTAITDLYLDGGGFTNVPADVYNGYLGSMAGSNAKY